MQIISKLKPDSVRLLIAYLVVPGLVLLWGCQPIIENIPAEPTAAPTATTFGPVLLVNEYRGRPLTKYNRRYDGWGIDWGIRREGDEFHFGGNNYDHYCGDAFALKEQGEGQLPVLTAYSGCGGSLNVIIVAIEQWDLDGIVSGAYGVGFAKGLQTMTVTPDRMFWYNFAQDDLYSQYAHLEELPPAEVIDAALRSENLEDKLDMIQLLQRSASYGYNIQEIVEAGIPGLYDLLTDTTELPPPPNYTEEGYVYRFVGHQAAWTLALIIEKSGGRNLDEWDDEYIPYYVYGSWWVDPNAPIPSDEELLELKHKWRDLIKDYLEPDQLTEDAVQ